MHGDGAPDAGAALLAARAALEECRPAATSVQLVAQIRALAELQNVAAAALAEASAAFIAARRAGQIAAGERKKHLGRGVAREIGLAKRESHARASRYAGFVGVLTTELAATFAALRSGQTTEWRAMLVARETGWLSPEDRIRVDAQLGPRLSALGDREVEAEAARLAYALDPHGKMRQISRATGDRRVSLGPAPDAMCRLYGTLPLAQGVAAYAALAHAADAARAAGDERSRGQVMADTLVERITGQTRADDVPITVNMIVTDQALFNTGPRADEPATMSGHGPIPAALARDLLTREPAAGDGPGAGVTAPSVADPHGGTGVVARIRRLFADPAGRLVSMETSSRLFTPAMAEFIRLRDQRCATPWCGAPIRHIDHILDWASGGLTRLVNGEGLCEACNYAKQAPGWTTHVRPDGTISQTSPTGHALGVINPAQPPLVCATQPMIDIGYPGPGWPPVTVVRMHRPRRRRKPVVRGRRPPLRRVGRRNPVRRHSEGPGLPLPS